MSKKLLCPSMMCANFANLEKDTKDLEVAGVDIFHMDIMDGSFVPNFGMGLQDYELIRSVTDKPLDVHLMVQTRRIMLKCFPTWELILFIFILNQISIPLVH